MKLNILHVRDTNMGDHGEFVPHAVEPLEGETVEDLVRRTIAGTEYSTQYSDRIEIRLIQIKLESHDFEPSDTTLGQFGRCTVKDANGIKCGRYRSDKLHEVSD